MNQILAALLDGDRGDATLPELLCSACVEALPVNSVGLTLITDRGHEGVLVATDGLARVVEELQFTLGEGPGIDASRESRPVLQPSLAHTAPSRWPGFGPESLGAGVAAIFALPLQVGAIRLGVLSLYRRTAGPLADKELSEALAFAEAAVLVLLHLQDQVDPAEGLHPQLTDALGRPEIHQATGMIAVQAAVGLTESLLLLRAHTFSAGRSILEVACDVLALRLSFHPEDDRQE